MKARDLTSVPPSFEDALKPNYLGSPSVVEKLLGGFVSEIADWVRARGEGKMTAGEMQSEAKERSKEFARIFSGQNPDYIPLLGWNSPSVGLAQYLKIDLGHFWQSNRGDYDDDPFRVFYGWLLWAVVDAMLEGDDDVTAAKMGSRIGQAVRFLTGTVKRS